MTLDWNAIIVGLINLAGIWLAHRSTAKNVDSAKAQVAAVHQEVQNVHTFVTQGGMLSNPPKGGPVT